MDVCCSESSKGTSPVNFYPDCYSWCNVDLPPFNGLDPSIQALQKLSRCLAKGQSPGYFKEMMCLNGTAEEPGASTSIQSSPVSTLTSDISTSTQSATTTLNPDAPTGTQPTAPTSSVPGLASRCLGTGTKIAAGLLLSQVLIGTVC